MPPAAACRRGSPVRRRPQPTLRAQRVHPQSPLTRHRSTLKPRMNTKAISTTERNSSTDTAPPRPECGAGDGLAVGEERHALGLLGAAGHDEDGVEDAEGVERAEQQRHHDRRLHVGDRHPPQPLPGGGAVDLGRLLQLLGHLGQPGEQQQRDERRRLPHLGQDDHGQRRPPVREPGLVAEPEPLVDEARVEGEGVLPGEGGDHGDDAVGDEDRRADRTPAEDDAVHHRGEGEADDQLDGHRDDGDEHGGEDVLPPQAVGEHDAVVAQADELLAAGSVSR